MGNKATPGLLCTTRSAPRCRRRTVESITRRKRGNDLRQEVTSSSFRFPTDPAFSPRGEGRTEALTGSCCCWKINAPNRRGLDYLIRRRETHRDASVAITRPLDRRLLFTTRCCFFADSPLRRSLPALSSFVETKRRQEFGIVSSREVEFPARLVDYSILVPVLQVARPILSLFPPLPPSPPLSSRTVPYVESFLSGFAIGVLKRDTDEALMNLRRDSFAPPGRYPLTRFDVERWDPTTRKGRINLEIVARVPGFVSFARDPVFIARATNRIYSVYGGTRVGRRELSRGGQDAAKVSSGESTGKVPPSPFLPPPAATPPSLPGWKILKFRVFRKELVIY